MHLLLYCTMTNKCTIISQIITLLRWHHQPTRRSKICFIASFKLALHVSGDSFAHLQEHFDCTYRFLGQCTDCAVCCRPVTQMCVPLVLISVKRLSRPQDHSAIGRILCQWKIPVTPSGIELATFRFVAQHLSHWATAVPNYLTVWSRNSGTHFTGQKVTSLLCKTTAYSYCHKDSNLDSIFS